MVNRTQVPVKRHKVSGFTLLELMVVVTVIGVLASIAIPSYQQYSLKAKAIEATIFMRSMLGEFQEKYDSNGEFPLQLMDSKARTLSRLLKIKPRVRLSENRIQMPGSDLIKQYWYDANPRKNRNMAWIVVDFSDELFPNCGKRLCTVHLGMKRSSDGVLHTFCGRWTKSKVWGNFPLDLLSENCREECVNCKLKKIN